MSNSRICLSDCISIFLFNKYIAVGNEPFLATNHVQLMNSIYPAIQNLQNCLNSLNLGGSIKLVVPCNSDVYQSPPPYYPSQGTFRPELTQIMESLLQLLNANGSPFVVNIYPFFSLIEDPNFPQLYAFFPGPTTTFQLVDGKHVYTNTFDASLDTFVTSLANMGYANMPIVIGEVGWPTDGAASANLSAAQNFNQGVIERVTSTIPETPLRPWFYGVATLDTYLFSLYDEDLKSVAPGSFERHWGIFTSDGEAKYPLALPSEAAELKRRVVFSCIVIVITLSVLL